MARSCSAALTAVVLAAGASGATGAAAQPLTVCLPQDNPPLSHWVNGQAQGLDVRIAQALAQALGRDLRPVPFDSEYEKESSLALEANALLASGVCELVSAMPLLHSDLGPPARASARVPDHPGAPRRRERPYVPLVPLAASRAYLGSALGLVLRAPARPVTTLAALRDDPPLRLGVVAGTLSGTLAMAWRHGALRPQLVSLGQRENLLDGLGAGRYEAALLPLSQWDGWRQAHPQVPLAVAAWRWPIGVNLGFVLRADASALREALDGVITQARASGELARWAGEAGVTWQPPAEPEVSRGFDLPRLLQGQAD